MLRNLGIYAVGSIGSRLIMFMIVPIYSFFIAPSDFGYYDICFAVVMLVFPVISMQLRDGSFRFLLDAKTDAERTQIVSYTMFAMLRNTVVCVTIGVFMHILFDIKYMWYTLVFAVVFAVFGVVMQMLRGIGRNKVYVECGLISSFLIFAISVPLVAWADMGVEGVFIGNILARVVSMFYAEWRVKIFSSYVRRNVDVNRVGKEIMRFSRPLIVVNLIVSSIAWGNRFFIEYFLGLYDNGLYCVAVKFATMLEALAMIFNQTWQETAIRQYADADRDTFFSKIANAYIWVFVLFVIGISYCARIFYGIIVGAEYQESRWLVYPLVLSVMFLVMTVFYDVAYQCSKNTSRQLPCLVIALIISVVTNYLFTIWWGIYGILASINVTYLFMLVYKIIDTRRYMRLHIDFRSRLAAVVLVLSGVMFYLIDNQAWVVAYFAVALLAMLILCPEFVKQKVLKKLGRGDAATS
ncbi:MAG: lipopolysaccharide biosynthesis protein [Muribaculaceae bacterium]